MSSQNGSSQYTAPEDVRDILRQHFPDCQVEVSGDGRHFDVVIVGEVFAGLRPVKRQQLVYAALNPQIADGSVHAVNMKTLTPAEAGR